MNFKRLKRFSLFSLLVVVSAVAIAFGGMRIYRQRVLAVIRDLNAEGVGVIMVKDKSSWLGRISGDEFWQRRPRTAEVYVSRTGSDEYKIGSKTMAWTEAEAHLLALRERLHSMGINDIQIWTFDSQRQSSGPSGPPTLPAGANPQDWIQQRRAESERTMRIWKFASVNGMSGGMMQSQDEIDKRLVELKF